MKRSKLSLARKSFERATLKRFAAAGATPADLAQFRRLLVKGRKAPGDDYCAVLNWHSQEKAGIEFALRCLAGDVPDSIIFRINPLPEVSHHG